MASSAAALAAAAAAHPPPPSAAGGGGRSSQERRRTTKRNLPSGGLDSLGSSLSHCVKPLCYERDIDDVIGASASAASSLSSSSSSLGLDSFFSLDFFLEHWNRTSLFFLHELNQPVWEMHQTDYTQKLYQRSLAHIANNIAHFVADKPPSAAPPPLTDARVLAAVAGLFCTYVLYATQLPERETTTVLADASGRTRRVVTGPWTRPYVDPATLAALGQLAELASANRNCMDDVCSVLAHLLVGVDGGAPICVIGAFPFVNCSTPAPALAADKSAAAAAAAAAGESAANKRLLSVLSAETVRPTKGAGALLGAKFVVSQDERRKLALSKAWEVAHEVAHTLCPVTAQAAKEIESTQAVSNDEMAEVLGLSSAPTATLALADYDNALTGLGADEPPHRTAQSLNLLQDVLFNFSKTCSNALGQAAVKQRLTTAVGADTLASTPPAGTTNLTREAMVAALAMPDHDGEPGLGISVAVPWRNLRRHERKRLQVPAKKEIGVAKTTTKVTRRKLPGIAYKFSRKEAAKEKEARYRQRYRDAAVGPAQVLAVAVGSTQKPLGVGILPDIGPAGNRAPDPVMMPPPPPPRVRTTVSKPGHRKVGRPRKDPENSTTERPKKQPSLTTAPDGEKRKRGRPKKDPSLVENPGEKPKRGRPRKQPPPAPPLPMAAAVASASTAAAAPPPPPAAPPPARVSPPPPPPPAQLPPPPPELEDGEIAPPPAKKRKSSKSSNMQQSPPPPPPPRPDANDIPEPPSADAMALRPSGGQKERFGLLGSARTSYRRIDAASAVRTGSKGLMSFTASRKTTDGATYRIERRPDRPHLASSVSAHTRAASASADDPHLLDL